MTTTRDEQDEDGDALTRLFQLEVGHTLTRENVEDIEAVAADWQAANETRLLKAATLVVKSKFDQYRRGNGHMAFIEGDDGEKCWIVPFDAMSLLESAVAASGASAARSAPVAEGWRPIETAPKGRKVLVSVTRHGGHKHTLLARYWKRFTLEAADDCEHESLEHDADDGWFHPPGWYEETDADDAPVNSIEPTHWMPLPPSPGAEVAQAAASDSVLRRALEYSRDVLADCRSRGAYIPDFVFNNIASALASTPVTPSSIAKAVEEVTPDALWDALRAECCATNPSSDAKAIVIVRRANIDAAFEAIRSRKGGENG